MLKRAGLCTVVIAWLSGLASVACAGTVTATLTGIPLYRTVDFSLDGGATFSRAPAGEMHWVRTGGTEPGAPFSHFTTFCVELTQYVHINRSHAFDVVELEHAPVPGGQGVGSGMGHAKAEMIRELWGRYYDQAKTHDASAAFQVAVWEIVYDDGLALNDGSFRIRWGHSKPAYVTLAENWLGSLDGTGPRETLGGLSSLKLQDQAFVAPVHPAGWGGMAILLGLAIRKIRLSTQGH